MSQGKNKSDENYIELTYAGSLQIEKLFIKKASIVLVQKPVNDEFGCIIQVMGDKFGVKESYEYVTQELSIIWE